MSAKTVTVIATFQARPGKEAGLRAALLGLDAHLKSAHVAALLPRVDELCTALPEIKIWERID